MRAGESVRFFIYMENILLKRLMIPTITALIGNFLHAAPPPPTEAEFAKMLISQEGETARYCENEVMQKNPGINAENKKRVHLYCLCLAKTPAHDAKWLKKMYDIVKISKNKSDYVQRMEIIGEKIGAYCQAQIH